MSRLTKLEMELMTHDPIAQIRQCLACTAPVCTNCVYYSYRDRHETAKQRGRRVRDHAEA